MNLNVTNDTKDNDIHRNDDTTNHLNNNDYDNDDSAILSPVLRNSVSTAAASSSSLLFSRIGGISSSVSSTPRQGNLSSPLLLLQQSQLTTLMIPKTTTTPTTTTPTTTIYDEETINKYQMENSSRNTLLSIRNNTMDQVTSNSLVRPVRNDSSSISPPLFYSSLNPSSNRVGGGGGGSLQDVGNRNPSTFQVTRTSSSSLLQQQQQQNLLQPSRSPGVFTVPSQHPGRLVQPIQLSRQPQQLMKQQQPQQLMKQQQPQQKHQKIIPLTTTSRIRKGPGPPTTATKLSNVYSDDGFLKTTSSYVPRYSRAMTLAMQKSKMIDGENSSLGFTNKSNNDINNSSPKVRSFLYTGDNSYNSNTNTNPPTFKTTSATTVPNLIKSTTTSTTTTTFDNDPNVLPGLITQKKKKPIPKIPSYTILPPTQRPLLCCFYAEFDNIVGPKIVHECPHGFMEQDIDISISRIDHILDQTLRELVVSPLTQQQQQPKQQQQQQNTETLPTTTSATITSDVSMRSTESHKINTRHRRKPSNLDINNSDGLNINGNGSIPREQQQQELYQRSLGRSNVSDGSGAINPLDGTDGVVPDTVTRDLYQSIFDSCSEYIISGPELSGSIVNLSTHNIHVLTRPTSILDVKYERNCLSFCVGFILRRTVDPRPFRTVLSKLALLLRDMEMESQYLSQSKAFSSTTTIPGTAPATPTTSSASTLSHSNIGDVTTNNHSMLSSTISSNLSQSPEIDKINAFFSSSKQASTGISTTVATNIHQTTAIPSKKPKLQALLERLVISLNSVQGECNLILNASGNIINHNTNNNNSNNSNNNRPLFNHCDFDVDHLGDNLLNLKLFHPRRIPAAPVKDYDVPILLRRDWQLKAYDWDLSINWVSLHIDGVSNARQISQKAEVDLEMVRACLRVLKHHGVITLVDMFFYSNRYECTAETAAMLAGKCDKLLNEAFDFVLSDGKNEDSFNLITPPNAETSSSKPNDLYQQSSPLLAARESPIQAMSRMSSAVMEGSYGSPSNTTLGLSQPPAGGKYQYMHGGSFRIHQLTLSPQSTRETKPSSRLQHRHHVEIKAALVELYCKCNRGISIGDLILSLLLAQKKGTKKRKIDSRKDRKQRPEVLSDESNSSTTINWKRVIRMIDHRRLVVFGVVNGLLKRVHNYPLLLDTISDWDDLDDDADNIVLPAPLDIHERLATERQQPELLGLDSNKHHITTTTTTTTTTICNSGSTTKLFPKNKATVNGKAIHNIRHQLAKQVGSMMDGTHCDDEIVCRFEVPLEQLLDVVRGTSKGDSSSGAGSGMEPLTGNTKRRVASIFASAG